MTQNVLELGPGWVCANPGGVAAEFQFMNLGQKPIEVHRNQSGSVGPAQNGAHRHVFQPGMGHSGDLDTLFIGGAGGYLWFRAPYGSEVSVGWV